MKNIALLLAVGACASLASADSAILNFSGGASYASYYGSFDGDVVGWDFSISETIYVTDLGIWRDTGAFGLPDVNSDHQVGIWDSGQNLLTSTVVGPSSPADGDYRFESVGSIMLAPGTYTIGALYTTDDDDEYVSSASSLSMSPDITWVQSRYPAVGELGFVFPEFTGSTFGRIGPNFQYVIPAPSSLALLGLGGLALRRRR